MIKNTIMIQNFFFNKFVVSFCDTAESWQFGTQDPATPNMEGMIFFHSYLCYLCLAIVVFVTFFLASIYLNFNNILNKTPSIFSHSSLLEIIWTIIPAIILLLIAVPSFGLLYAIDELIDPSITLKIVGHQWYWSYEYSDFIGLKDEGSINFDSYMVPTNELIKGSLRLLEVDNRVVLPTKTHIRLLITAADVLHCWAVPSFGVKVDACPGRLIQASLYIKRQGTFYGQCSEICGVNHGFMPIVVRGVSRSQFIRWLYEKRNLFIEN
jgi:cytochrome c oxidase subunit 2